MAANPFLSSIESAIPGRFGADMLAGSNSKQKGDDVAIKKPLLTTVRFNLELFQPDSTSYPSFNYSKLIAGEKKKQKKIKEKQKVFQDPFEENDDDVARIAREMEKKYGNTYGSVKGRNKKDDFCDIGMGYDESDSFIDNTEAYDEVVPEEVETIEGGFYINCGALEFKSLRPERPIKTRTDDIIKMPERSRKVIISSSSESDESDTSEDEDDDDDNSDSDDEDSNDGSSVKTTKSKDSSSVPSSTSSTVKSLKSKKSITKTKANTSSSNSPRPESDADALSSNPLKTTTIKDMLKAKRDKFLKHQTDGESKVIEVKSSSNKTSDNETTNDESSDSDDSESGNSEGGEENAGEIIPKQSAQPNPKDNAEKLRTADTRLPDLEDEVRNGINQFRDMVKSLNLTGKKFQFTENLKDLFLRIDESLLCVEKSQRNMVFAHLEFHLTLPKYYFLRKAKQLRITEEKQKTSHAISKLTKAISEIMPQCFTNYTSLKNAIQTTDGEHLTVTPKKKFLWNNHSRTLLYEVYQVRWTSYPVLGTRKQTLEEFISGFMKTKIVKLWPTGWMCYEELQKEIEKQKNSLKKNKMKEKSTNNSNTNTNVNSNPSNAASSPYGYKVAAPTFGPQDDVAMQNSNMSPANKVGNALKRKSTDVLQKTSKSKAQKLTHGVVNQIKQNEPPHVTMQMPSNADIALDLVSPTKKTDGKVTAAPPPSLPYNVMPSTSSSIPGSMNININQHSKAQNEPKTVAPTLPATHIIDLDNYSTTSEILKTTKKLAAARVVTSNVSQKGNESDDNDCVEFVGVIQPSSGPLTNPPIKHKTKTAKKPPNMVTGRANVPNISPFNSFTPEMASIYAQSINSANIAKSSNDIKNLMNNLDAYKEFNRNYVSQQNNLGVNPLFTTSNSTGGQNNKQKPRE